MHVDTDAQIWCVEMGADSLYALQYKAVICTYILSNSADAAFSLFPYQPMLLLMLPVFCQHPAVTSDSSFHLGEFDVQQSLSALLYVFRK